MRRRFLALMTVLLAGLLALLPGASTAQQASQRDVAISSSVLVLIVDWNQEQILGNGSGTIISRNGMILTNNHVITDEAGNISSEGMFPIGINVKGANGPPEILFLAEVVQNSPDWDLALLQITKNIDGSPLRDDLVFPFLPLGDSDLVEIEDTLRVIGFPGLGGETVTLTRGVVAGFDTQDGTRTMIKTDTEISPGNSGGTAINDRFELVGVPTSINVSEAGKIGQVRPINIAKAIFNGNPPPFDQGGGAVPEQPAQGQQPDPDAPTATIDGQILDADTGRAISGALIGVLQPGLTYDSWDGGKDGLYAVAQTDRRGNFTLSEPIEIGQGYTVILEAEGYQQAYEDNFVLAPEGEGDAISWTFRLAQAR